MSIGKFFIDTSANNIIHIERYIYKRLWIFETNTINDIYYCGYTYLRWEPSPDNWRNSVRLIHCFWSKVVGINRVVHNDKHSGRYEYYGYAEK